MSSFALEGAKKVLVYNLGQKRDAEAVSEALASIRVIDFDVLCYPYDDDGTDVKASIKNWVKSMVEDEGSYIQAVTSNYASDCEYVINVTQGLKNGDTTYTAAQISSWVAGITAGATSYQSNTGRTCTIADDVSPRLTKTETEAAITAGEFVFKVNNTGLVTCVYDVNSLTTITETKGKPFKKNRFIRVISGVNNDINEIFESNFKGKINNDASGRSRFKASLIDYFRELERLRAIQNFTPDDLSITSGTDSDSVVVDVNVQTVDSIEKVYMTVTLS